MVLLFFPFFLWTLISHIRCVCWLRFCFAGMECMYPISSVWYGIIFIKWCMAGTVCPEWVQLQPVSSHQFFQIALDRTAGRIWNGLQWCIYVCRSVGYSNTLSIEHNVFQSRSHAVFFRLLCKRLYGHCKKQYQTNTDRQNFFQNSASQSKL